MLVILFLQVKLDLSQQIFFIDLASSAEGSLKIQIWNCFIPSSSREEVRLCACEQSNSRIWKRNSVLCTPHIYTRNLGWSMQWIKQTNCLIQNVVQHVQSPHRHRVMKHTFKDKMMAQLHSSCPPHIDGSFEKYIKYLQKTSCLLYGCCCLGCLQIFLCVSIVWNICMAEKMWSL